MKKPQGNHPLRFPTIYNIPISKEEMGIITSQGLIKGIDENGFVIFDSDNLSGSHVYWANLKEIRQSADGDSIVLIYKNMSDEILGNHHFGWNDLMENIPEEFGDFSNMIKSSESEEEDSSQDLNEKKEEIGVENATYILSKINKMREDFMEDDFDDNNPEEATASEEKTEKDNKLEESEQTTKKKVTQSSDSNSNTETRKVAEDKVEVNKTRTKTSNEDLLKRILAEASGSSYDGNLRFQNTDSELPENLKIWSKYKNSSSGFSRF